jgi:putative membrane protein
MLAELAAVALGTLAGAIAGLLPGLHVNLLAAVALQLALPPVPLALAVLAMAASQRFLEYIPATFLGAPDDATAAAALPAHRLLLRGLGPEAVRLSVCGGLAGLIVGIAVLPFLLGALPSAYQALHRFTVPVLLAVLAGGVLRERALQKTAAGLTVLLAGCLGLLTLDSTAEPLLPLLAGLFGVPGLLLGLGGARIPPQRDAGLIAPTARSLAAPAVAGVGASALVTLFPGLGPAQGASVAEFLMGSIAPPVFLVLAGAIGTADVAVSLATAVAIGKARNGAVASAEQLIVLLREALPGLAAATAIGGGLAAALTLWLAPRLGTWLPRIPYRRIAAVMLGLIGIAVLALSGIRGLLVLATGAAIGAIPVLTGCRRVHAMACLILPIALR